ncbi:MAG: SPOR domain-containing protein [Gammaproteobacteria bacterium]|nr:SPOR domain-containing protein [Gammaproteobacteria bacterium]MYH86075.1 SPOR domain-containing protein [Gammaproteobacteria bacterium]MYK06016.1 SPOR domain-containing protein [Gammaproteobacteria bacterium]
MARTKSQAFPTGILLLAVAASAALLRYLVLSPADPDTAGDLPGSPDNTGDTLEFEFYDRLPENEVQVNSPADEPAEPGPTDIEQLAELLTTDSQIQLENATEALEQIAETIVSGLETPMPDRVAAPEPVPPVPVAPQSQAETILAAPAPAEAQSQPGTVLQSGAFSQQELALSELQRQRSLGLEVEMRQRPGQDGPMFLLQSGPYDSRDRLEEAEMVFRLNNIDTARLSTP